MLLHLGVRGSNIHLVQPPPTSNITCINNYSLESAVEDALQAAGVTIHQDALLAQWNDGEDPDPISSASFTTPTKPFKLPCSVSRSREPPSLPPDLRSERWWMVNLQSRFGGLLSNCSVYLLLSNKLSGPGGSAGQFSLEVSHVVGQTMGEAGII